MIITVASIKGGAGKSSICQTLAVYLLQNFPEKSLLLVDADPQKTTAEWIQERNENEDLPGIPCVEQSGKIHGALQEHAKNYDFVLVDTGGADSTAMRSALAVSNAVLIPCRPKKRDLKAIWQMADTIETALLNNPKMKVLSVITQAPTLPSQGNRIASAKSVLDAAELNPLRHITCNRNAWDDSDENGCTVLEYEDKKAKDEANALYEEVMEVLNRD
ncbi:MAG: AAA family ATPase [Pseudomonadales bacterium]|nr:AAA family ATPase [Pseudomonadales bacterium]